MSAYRAATVSARGRPRVPAHRRRFGADHAQRDPHRPRRRGMLPECRLVTRRWCRARRPPPSTGPRDAGTAPDGEIEERGRRRREQRGRPLPGQGQARSSARRRRGRREHWGNGPGGRSRSDRSIRGACRPDARKVLDVGYASREGRCSWTRLAATRLSAARHRSDGPPVRDERHEQHEPESGGRAGEGPTGGGGAPRLGRPAAIRRPRSRRAWASLGAAWRRRRGALVEYSPSARARRASRETGGCRRCGSRSTARALRGMERGWSDARPGDAMDRRHPGTGRCCRRIDVEIVLADVAIQVPPCAARR